ncbi:MAG TPA: hypothetical protein VK571_06380 [Gemmatimonadaceae bacterium]|nr:hypothetical protein [Gemmatimonadaceae bacterium]
MSKQRAFRVVWLIERRPLRGGRNWRAIEWPTNDREGKEKVKQYNRLIADCEYRLQRYEPRVADVGHFSEAAIILRQLLEKGHVKFTASERAWLVAEQRRLP